MVLQQVITDVFTFCLIKNQPGTDVEPLTDVLQGLSDPTPPRNCLRPADKYEATEPSLMFEGICQEKTC